MTTTLIFLKAPQSGQVKTRLAAKIGSEQAMHVYRALVEKQIKAIQNDCTVEIHFTPRRAESEMRAWLGSQFNYYAQAEGSLTERLSHGVTEAFKRTQGPVICIGGDCPNLGGAHIHAAAERLAGGDDVVFGPTEDGGYYLVAISAAHTGIFEAIPWSSDDTLKVSMKKAGALGLQVNLLEMLYDIDTINELERAMADGFIFELAQQQSEPSLQAGASVVAS